MESVPDTTLKERLEQVGVSRAAARVLAACATNTKLTPDLPLEDVLAAEIHDRLGGCAREFTVGELRHSALRTMVVDRIAEWFFEREPSALGVGAWSMLGTRAHRLRHARWVDLDVPEVAKLRLHLLPERSGWTQASACLCCSPWADAIHGTKERRLLFVLDESVLPIRGSALVRFLDEVSRIAGTGSELIVAFDRQAPLRPVTPLSSSSAVELVLRDTGELVRYPRLRFVEEARYPDEVGHALFGVNAIARLHGGVDHPVVAHLTCI